MNEAFLPPLSNPDLLRILPLGGLGQIGMNLMVLESCGKLLLIDCGLQFPDAQMTGVDLLLPDVSVLRERQGDILAVLLTHGHEDHIGALPFLVEELGRPPVYGSRFTLALLEGRLKERGNYRASALNAVDEHSRLELGPFAVEFFPVAHSMPEGFGLAVETPAGLVIHSGDFKLDPTPLDGRRTDLSRLARYGQQGVLLLLADSTNAEHEGHTPSETSVGPALRQLIAQAKGRVIAATFSSNLHRIQQLADAGRACGRAIAPCGRSLENNLAIGRALGLLQIPEGALVGAKMLRDIPLDHQLLLTTGTQAEAQSSLMRMAREEHTDCRIQEGDTVILSSKMIPGNERAVYGMINDLRRLGAKVYFEKNASVHVSGHAGREELRLLQQLVRPRYFVPVHGEYRHLRLHAELAMDLGLPAERACVIENGEPLLLSENGLQKEAPIALSALRVCGGSVGDILEDQVKHRSQMAHYGLLLVQGELDEDGRPAGLRLLSRGLCGGQQGRSWMQEARGRLLAHLEELPLETIADPQLLEAEIRRPLKRYFNRTHSRRPLILVLVAGLGQSHAAIDIED